MTTTLHPRRLLTALLGSAALAVACSQGQPEGTAPSRFAAAGGGQAEKAVRAFCEKSYDAAGPGSLRLPALPEQPLPVAQPGVATGGGWRWVNLWATWCTPCVEEFPLLRRWIDSLRKDGVQVQLELWSADDDPALLASALRRGELPGQQHWLGGNEAMLTVLVGVQAGKGAALPVHLFVDAQGQLRCLRVGAVHEADYGAIKALLTSGS